MRSPPVVTLRLLKSFSTVQNVCDNPKNMSLTNNNPLPSRPHIISCLYRDDLAATSAFEDLVPRLCTNTGFIRFEYEESAGLTILALRAHDAAAALHSARLPWGAGTPIILSDEVCAGLGARQTPGQRLPRANASSSFTRRDVAQTMAAPSEASNECVHMMALNTDAQPWASAGGICGAVCDSIADADHIREVIVTEHHATFEGMVVAFGNDNEAVAAVVAGTPESNAVGAETLLRLAGNLDYEPDAPAAWELWAMRIRAGSAPLPITCEEPIAPGFLSGKSAARRVRTHRPTGNQPCPCGSGSKYKRCCGR
jgi:hypothetical protein